MHWGDVRIPERIWDKVYPCPMSGCWLCLGSDNGVGYQKIWTGKKNQYAHRVMYEVANGVVVGELDHKCRVRSCCNPEHLEDVTHAENCRRGDLGTFDRFAPRQQRSKPGPLKRKMHCARGHVLIEVGGRQVCRVCRAEHALARYHAGKSKRWKAPLRVERFEVRDGKLVGIEDGT